MAWKAYLAARYSRRDEMREYAEVLEGLNLATVECAWIAGDHDWSGEADTPEALAAAQQYAIDDLRDLARAQVVIVFTEEPVLEPLRERLSAELVEAMRSAIHPEQVADRILAGVGRNRGGRHVEYGLALASHLSVPQTKYVVICGPAENVFHTLPQVPRFATFLEVVAHLTAVREQGEQAKVRSQLVLPPRARLS